MGSLPLRPWRLRFHWALGILGSTGLLAPWVSISWILYSRVCRFYVLCRLLWTFYFLVSVGYVATTHIHPLLKACSLFYKGFYYLYFLLLVDIFISYSGLKPLNHMILCTNSLYSWTIVNAIQIVDYWVVTYSFSVWMRWFCWLWMRLIFCA